MKFDVITIFPEMFDTLDASLIGKARESGRIEVGIRNLRDFASGKHLSVDAPPAGGGAGMVMRPDIWGEAIDSALELGDAPAAGSSELAVEPDGPSAAEMPVRRVLAIPTPSGKPLTQRDVEDLAHADQIVIACGRYEGIDARVAEHYRGEDVEVFEYSLGDYVLNGGEVAALALVEAVGRLVPGVVGNPKSLTEESHGEAGLLEYPVYTSPRTWRELEVPSVLFSGHHGNIDRYRRDEALRKTMATRPDMIEVLAGQTEGQNGPNRDSGPLTKRDLEVIAEEGLALVPQKARLTFSEGTLEDIPEVSALATRLFPYACPPGTPQDEIDGFTSTFLTPEVLAFNVSDEDGRITTVHAETADGDSEMVGYTLMFPTLPEDMAVPSEEFCLGGRASYLSKFYLDPHWQGSGVAGAMLSHALKDAEAAWKPTCVVLGTNRKNKGAMRFYRRHGFVKWGNRIFDVGGTEHRDYVFVRDLTANPVL